MAMVDPLLRVDPPILADLPILFEDDFLVAVHKPTGMLVHRTKMDAREQVYAMQTVRNQVGGHVFPVHRLDKPTSGVLLFAKDAETARKVSDLIQSRAVQKTYQAVIRGWTPDEEKIDYALMERPDKTTDSRAKLGKPPQDAVTSFKTVSRIEVARAVGRYPTARYSVVDIFPETGRKHQIRRHLKHIFHPIIGDRKYGDRAHNAFFREVMGCDRLLLIASTVSFTHPITNLPVVIHAETDFPSSVTDLFRGRFV